MRHRNSSRLLKQCFQIHNHDLKKYFGFPVQKIRKIWTFTSTGNLEPVLGWVPKICSFTSQEAQINHKLFLPYSCSIHNTTGNTDNIGRYDNPSPKHKTLSASAVCRESNIPPSPIIKNKYIKCLLKAPHLLHRSFWHNMHVT